MCEIELAWIKGHSDNTGNEIADAMAREARLQTPLPALARTMREVKSKIKNDLFVSWQREWRDMKDCKIARRIVGTVSPLYRRIVKGLKTSKLTLLVEAATGHGFFGGHLSKWRSEIDGECKLCYEGDETSLHLWEECPALEWIRRTQLSEAVARGTPLPRQILKFFEQEAIAELLQQNKLTMEEAVSGLSIDTPPSDEEYEEEEEEAPPPPREEKGKKNCCIS